MTQEFQYIDSKKLYELLIQDIDRSAEWPGDTVWEMMLGAFLVQNTTWHNTELALEKLGAATQFDPEAIANMDKNSLIEAIYSAGFHTNKSQLIHHFFNWLAEYDYDLGKIKASFKTPAQLRIHLLAMKGIGPETADVLLLYAFQAPAFVADNYARKLYAGLGSSQAGTYAKLKTFVESTTNLTVDQWKLFHLGILEYGKENLRGKGPHRTALFDNYRIKE